MKLEKYFEFISNESIRVAGTRVGIETILRDYKQGARPEEIVLHYPTLFLEQVHATITYYLANQEKVESYLEKVRQSQEEAWREHQRSPRNSCKDCASVWISNGGHYVVRRWKQPLR